MTEKHPQNLGPEYYRALDRAVDTQNISYYDARQQIDPSQYRALPPHANTEPIHGPFTKPTTEMLDEVHQAQYLSQIGRKMGPAIAKAAMQISSYEIEAIHKARENRADQLRAPKGER